TLIILPDHEEILDFVCGDKDFWVVSGAQNLAYVKPAKAGATTNLNLVTSSGHVYSFLLTEGAGDPDLKLYVAPDDTMNGGASVPRKYVSADEIAELRRSTDQARQEADRARTEATKAADERITTFRSTYPLTLTFPYLFKSRTKPFNVSAMFTDGTF